MAKLKYTPLKSISDNDLIKLRITVDKELKLRNIKFSVGELGETIAINFFNSTPGLVNLQRAPTGTKNVDALSRDGERFSIKTIKEGNKTGTVYPGKDDEQLFEYLLMVNLDGDYEMETLHRFSWNDFLKVRLWDKTMKAWYIPKTRKAINHAEQLYKENEHQ